MSALILREGESDRVVVSDTVEISSGAANPSINTVGMSDITAVSAPVGVNRAIFGALVSEAVTVSED